MWPSDWRTLYLLSTAPVKGGAWLRAVQRRNELAESAAVILLDPSASSGEAFTASPVAIWLRGPAAQQTAPAGAA
jgi:hypothetical protein